VRQCGTGDLAGGRFVFEAPVAAAANKLRIAGNDHCTHRHTAA
jgi:hypothetical protein